MEKLYREIMKKYGNPVEAAKALGYKDAATVRMWRIRGIPKSRIAEIHLDTGIPLKRLLAG